MTETSGQLDERDLFVLADRTLLGVVNRIRTDQWPMTMPRDFQTRASDHVPTLLEIINYHAYDDAWVPDMLAGRTMAEVGAEEHRGNLLGDAPDDHAGYFTAYVEAACAAAQQVSDLDAMVHCSFGDFTVQQYFWQITLFRGLRAHDIAKALGQDTELPPDLVQGIWDQVRPNAEEWRSYGVFGPAVPVAGDAPLQDRLLGLTGRQPD
jgi:uncharacterized protein (TIGR03086 family)